MRILVIGGYGAFGTRIVRRLKRIHNLEVLVGGRNASKADVVLDITKRENLMKNLSELKPHLVIHTAGPFNNSEDYAVARACLAVSSTGHKCHYLDLADNSEYVMGFGILDEEARKKGCLLVTGASTTPAVTTVRYAHIFCALPEQLNGLHICMLCNVCMYVISSHPMSYYLFLYFMLLIVCIVCTYGSRLLFLITARLFSRPRLPVLMQAILQETLLPIMTTSFQNLLNYKL
jgi:hypothetical protein